MNDEPTPMVQGDQTPAPVAPDATPAAGGVTTNVTPTQAPLDAEALKREFEAKQEELKRDVNRVKSTFQSREAQLVREAKEREQALQAELQKIQLSTMDDETRKTYEAELARNRASELERQLQEEKQQFETYRATQNAIAQFRSLGVPENILNNASDFDELLQNGWDWVTNKLLETQKTTQTPPAPIPPTPLPTAPRVDTGGASTPPSTRPTWDEIVGQGKKYESREQVYQLFQEGRIPPDQVPL